MPWFCKNYTLLPFCCKMIYFKEILMLFLLPMCMCEINLQTHDWFSGIDRFAANYNSFLGQFDG